MSISRRTSWLGIYAYSDTGVEGMPVDTWTLAGTWWGRIDDYRGRQRSNAGANESQVDAVIQFADEVTVPANAIIVDGSSITAATAYKVAYSLPRQLRRVALAYCSRVDRNKLDPAALLLNGAFVLDGSQILNGVGV
jgi:head-tail adaptor